MKLLTLTEYCLMIFFTGVFLAVTGFTARDIGLYVGIALIYTFSHLFSKRMLEKRGKEKQRGESFFQRSGHCRISAGHGIVHRRRRLVCQIKNACCPNRATAAFLFCLTHIMKREEHKLRGADDPVFGN